jgi:hypothetical protein
MRDLVRSRCKELVTVVLVALSVVSCEGDDSSNDVGDASLGVPAVEAGADRTSLLPESSATTDTSVDAGVGDVSTTPDRPADSGADVTLPDVQETATEAAPTDGQTDGPDEGAAIEPTDGPVAVHGAAGKGPFILGSSISIFPITAAGDVTGQVFPATTSDDVGSFSLSLAYQGPALIQANGFYFNEITGALSTSAITLWAYAQFGGSSETVNVNTITHLAHSRVATLLKGGAALATATAQAETELRTGLAIGPASFTPSAPGVAMSFAGGDNDSNAYLFAVSAVLAQAARTAAGPSGSVDASLTSLLNQIAADLAPNGTIAPSIRSQLHQAEQSLDTYAAMDAMTSRFAAVGINVKAPNLDRVIDTDGDGIANADDNCRFVSNATQQHVNSVCAYRAVVSPNKALEQYKAFQSRANLVIGDINADGIVDVVFNRSLVGLARGTSSPGIGLVKGGRLLDSIDWGSTGGDNSVQVGDVTGDGVADVVGLAYYVPGGPGSSPPVPQVALGNPYASDGIALDDLNGDGALDVILSSANNDWKTGQPGGMGILVLLNQGSDAGVAKFSQIDNHLDASPNGLHAINVATARLDADSRIDLVAFGPDNVSFALGKGDGTFQDSQVLYAAGTPQSLTGAGAVGDFNGDGHRDVAVLLEDMKTLRVFVGDGAGAFVGPPASDAGAADGGGSLRGFDMVSSSPLVGLARAAEMSGDTIDDIVVMDREGQVHVLVSSGQSLANDSVLPMGIIDLNTLHAFGVGDLNNDGTADVVAADYSSSGAMKAFLVFR